MKMLTQRLGLICAALLVLGTAVPAAAQERSESHIHVYNQTNDYVWITAYQNYGHNTARGAWCVRPDQHDSHGLRAHIAAVRAELSAGGCQGRHIILDKTVGFPTSMSSWNFAATKTKYGVYNFH